MNHHAWRALLGLAAVAALTACAGTSSPDDADYRAGRTVYRTCANCHGPQGDGGAGPSLADVRTTFPDCADHQRWVTLGSERWLAEVGDTYGAPGHAVEGGMPAFGADLSAEAIAQAALYERVRFGGGELAAEKAACGLGEVAPAP